MATDKRHDATTRGTSDRPDGLAEGKASGGPAAPELVDPIGGRLVGGDAVTFSWNPAPGATAYWLQVALNPEFADLVVDEEVGNTGAVQVSGVFPEEAELYWRMRAAAGEGWGPFGDAEEFSYQTGAAARAEEEAIRAQRNPDEREDLGPAASLIGAAETEAAAELTGDEKYFEEEEAEGVEHEGLAAAQIFYIGFWIVMILVSVVIVLYQLIRFAQQDVRIESAGQVQYPELRDTELEAANRLNNYGRVEGEGGVYRIPIDRAINLMADEAYQRGQGSAEPGVGSVNPGQ